MRKLVNAVLAVGLTVASSLAVLGCGAEPGGPSEPGNDPFGTRPAEPGGRPVGSGVASHVSPAGDHDFAPAAEPEVLAFVPQVPAVDGSLVPYTSMDGTQYNLRRFNGVYTYLLVPDDIATTMGIARMRQIVDEHDIVYSTLKELMNGEAGIVKPQSIAIVFTCGGALGCYGGAGQLEIDPGFFQTPFYFDVATHEMIHAFDGGPQYSSLFFVGPDQAHSWTWFWEMYVRTYLKKTHFEILPTLNVTTGFTTDEFYDYRVRERFGNAYEAFPGHSWTNCILNQACDPPGDWSPQDMATTAQGGVILRIAQLHGPAAIKNFLPKAQAIIAQRGYTPSSMSNQDRIDLLVESLSQAANTNLSCYFNAAGWNWPISSAAMTRLNALPANPLCNDSDGDGVRRFQHDCNDSNAAVKPGASETSNSVDDDCDGAVDDLLTAESTDYSNSPSSPKVVGFPTHITGTIASATDQDHFRMSLAAATTVRFTLRSLGTFVGTMTILQQGSTTNEYTHWDIGAGQLTSIKVDLAAGNWNFFLSGGATGAYEVMAQASTPVPMANDFWPASFTPAAGSVASGGPNRYSLPVPATPSAISGTANLLAQYWVSNFGLVGSVPAGSTTPFVWTAPSDTDARKITYRVQFRAGGVPVYQTSQQEGLLGPRPWTSQDIGAVGVAGSTSKFSEADLSVSGAGANIAGTSDSFRFVSTPLSGDGEVVAQVISLSSTDPSAKAGVMIRETTATNSTHAMMVFTPGGLSFQRRTTTGGTTSTTSGGTAPNPAWVKVVRQGSTFKGYSSSDGMHWTSVGSATITMASSVQAGVVVTSHSTSALATGNLDHVGVGPTASALFVTNSTTLGTGDTAIRNRLDSLGYNVTVKDAPSSTTADATGKTLVVVSSTITSTDVNTKFRTVTVPVVTWESGIFDDLGMTGTVSGTDFGTQASQTQVNVVASTHPMAAGLSGLVSASASSAYTWGVPNANAARVATLSGNSTRYVMFGYDSGAAMPGLSAPARRVGLFLGDTTATSLTANGWALFDASIRWASVR
jgi:regulation of enolase protein 1 (concanavalin A-like superfamily)